MRSTAMLLVAVALLAVLAVASKDYYALLGIGRSATRQEVKQAYRKLARKYHPDKNPGDKSASDQFVAVSQAYEVLADEEKRRVYDQYGEDGLKQSQSAGSGFHDPFDIFEQFAGFGFGRQYQSQQEKKGALITIPLSVSLKNLYLSTTIELDLSKQIICPKCRGSGAEDAADVETCSTCQGRGVRVVRQALAPGMIQQFQIPCDACEGKGKIIKKKCSICHGTKVKRGNTQISVTIEKGMADGERITFERDGDQSPDYTPGDVIFVLKTELHPVFTRKGNNLYMEMQIGLMDALLGFELDIKHFDGTSIKLKRTEVTQPGFVQLVTGKGMPIHQDATHFGNLFVQYRVLLPEKLSSQEQKNLRKTFQ